MTSLQGHRKVLRPQYIDISIILCRHNFHHICPIHIQIYLSKCPEKIDNKFRIIGNFLNGKGLASYSSWLILSQDAFDFNQVEWEEMLNRFFLFFIFYISLIFFIYLDFDQVEVEEVLNGLEGVWSRGVFLREALMDKL